MRENVAIVTICVALLLVGVVGAVQDLRLMSKVEREGKAPNDVVSLNMAECVATPALAYSYPGCATKTHRTELYYQSRIYGLALN